MAKKPIQTKQTGFNLFIAVGLSIALACIIVPLFFTGQSRGTNVFPPTSNVVQFSIDQLNSAQSSGTRTEAARWLGTQFSRQPDVLTSLGESLRKDPDPVVRATAANAIAQAARDAQANPDAGKLFASQEARIASLLQAQYDSEPNEAVRRCIIAAAGELDSADAGKLIETALADNDPSVKEEALRAKVERERRAHLKKMG